MMNKISKKELGIIPGRHQPVLETGPAIKKPYREQSFSRYRQSMNGSGMADLLNVENNSNIHNRKSAVQVRLMRRRRTNTTL